jgi:hypothetical protein
MANSLYPGFIKLKYTGASLTHYQILPVKVSGTPVVGVEPVFTMKGGGTANMTAALTSYLTLQKAEVPNTVTFVSADYWDINSVGADPVWIFTLPLTIVGTNATATDQLKQRVISFRSSLGGGAFNYLLQIPTNVAVNARQNFPTSNAPANATSGWLTGATSIVIARDGGWLVVPNWYTTKYNDAARKKVLDL